jgi:predicted RNA-binding Zn-ribbon protein involved in translation (DUF1610 family)
LKNGKCPNCGSTNIYRKVKAAQFGSGGSFVNTSMVSNPVDYESYICTDCGLFQTFVTDEKKLGEVKAKWTKA